MSTIFHKATDEEVESPALAGAKEVDTEEPLPRAPVGVAEPGQEARIQPMIGLIRRFITQIMPAPSLLEVIREIGAEDFKGRNDDDDPFTPEYWLDDTHRLLQELNCTPEEKLECAVSLLKDEAYEWWDVVTYGVDPSELTWDFFLAGFRKEYLGERFLEERRTEFLYLEQNDLSVREYEYHFVRLSRHVKELVPTEADMCTKFERGLTFEIRRYLAAARIREFSTLVDRAIAVEDVIIEKQRSKDKTQMKRGRGQVSFVPFPSAKRARDSQGPKYSTPTHNQRHEQRQNSGSTSRLVMSRATGSIGGQCKRIVEARDTLESVRVSREHVTDSKYHFIRDCPQMTTTAETERSTPKAQKGRRNGDARNSQKAVTETLARPDSRSPASATEARPGLIVGTFSLFNFVVHGLIVGGSRHSFISTSLIEREGLSRELTNHNASLTDILGNSLTVNKIWRGCPLEVQGLVFPANLMEHPFLVDFDLILGMDWLSLSHAVIDCGLGRIIIRGPDNEEVTFGGWSCPPSNAYLGSLFGKRAL
ncbi:uncharacterized protein LOC120115735 [Hibiscus syriacus]|uniref:uncharacterized protein LOC120115735 n=1 Tax=Hibiscus syriacus TaxID=106335 RepID=UPI0019214E30|nr:uncharacterized protein LOC120115735 [Hibiscus syriacus]XP_038992290.1 uncharacterized protein LOC120115735 [Hibiscus syriacus]XP_038992293.1 uncharacterized protein LOC120115735 [Hibiscus syriacus]XP_038992296.1 uncharacterized protein LOC120115735 [Hibiscus syriacus]